MNKILETPLFGLSASSKDTEEEEDPVSSIDSVDCSSVAALSVSITT